MIGKVIRILDKQSTQLETGKEYTVKAYKYREQCGLYDLRHPQHHAFRLEGVTMEQYLTDGAFEVVDDEELPLLTVQIEEKEGGDSVMTIWSQSASAMAELIKSLTMTLGLIALISCATTKGTAELDYVDGFDDASKYYNCLFVQDGDPTSCLPNIRDKKMREQVEVWINEL